MSARDTIVKETVQVAIGLWKKAENMYSPFGFTYMTQNFEVSVKTGKHSGLGICLIIIRILPNAEAQEWAKVKL